MQIRIKEGDLFAINNENTHSYILAQCISSDFGMKAGIVVMFNKFYDMKNVLISKFNGNLSEIWDNKGYVLAEKVFGDDPSDSTRMVYNLVTKQFVSESPTYETLKQSLLAAKAEMMKTNQTRIAFPLIGCGIDGLVWSKVYKIIQDVFQDTNFDIQVRYLERDKELLNH